MADLNGRAVRGGAVTLTAQAVKFILQLGSTMVLARLLTPQDFGLIAMVAVFTGFVELFKDLGLSMATIQREQITHEQVSMMFWLNVALSLLLTLVAAASAPAVAWFYGEPRLMPVTLAIAATFVFGGLSGQHAALLGRQMRLVQLAAIEIGALVAGIATAIVLAGCGAGYWALVAMTGAGAIMTTLLTWFFSGWWPGLPRRRTGVRSMLAFGASLTAFSVLNYLTRNADNAIVGSFVGAPALGIYSKAYGLLFLPIRQVNGPIAAVILPALSRLQHDPDRFRQYYLRAIETIALLTMPLVAFSLVTTELIVRTLLGTQWDGAVSVFRWLGIGAFAGAINVAPGWLCVSLGRTNRQLRWALLSAPVCVIAFLVGVHWGAEGVAAAFSISWTLLFIVLLAYACHGSPVSAIDIAMRLWRIIVVSVVAAFGLALVDSAVSLRLPAPLSLLVNGLEYLLICAAVWLALPGGRSALSGILFSARHLVRKEK